MLRSSAWQRAAQAERQLQRPAAGKKAICYAPEGASPPPRLSGRPLHPGWLCCAGDGTCMAAGGAQLCEPVAAGDCWGPQQMAPGSLYANCCLPRGQTRRRITEQSCVVGGPINRTFTSLPPIFEWIMRCSRAPNQKSQYNFI